MHNKQLPIVYVDMDRVICDYDAQHQKFSKMYPHIKYPQSLLGFFNTMDALPDAIESVKELASRYDLYFLTRPSVMNPMSYTEKRIYIENNFGIDMCEKLILCPNKGLLRGDMLIDDHIHDFQGINILFGSPNFKDWKSVLPIVNKILSTNL